jgi:hypothetical protein
MRSHHNVKCSKFIPLGSKTFQCTIVYPSTVICPSWYEFGGKNSVTVLIGHSHSQPFTNRIFHFLIIVGSVVSHVNHRFYKIRSFTLLRSHSSLLCWTDRRHHHGRPIDHFWTIRTAFRHDGSLRYHHTPLSNGREFLREKHVFAKKTHPSQQELFVRPSFQSRSNCSSTYSQPLTFESYVTCNPTKSAASSPTLFIQHVSYNHQCDGKTFFLDTQAKKKLYNNCL